MALAVRFGSELPPDSRPFFVAGLAPMTQLDPFFLDRVAGRLHVTSIPPEAEYVEPWFNAICRDDFAMAASIEEAFDSAGLHDVVMPAIRAINTFGMHMSLLLKVPQPISKVSNC